MPVKDSYKHRDKIGELINQHGGNIEEGEADFDLIGGILLFPTITDIAKSPLGIVFGIRTLDALVGLLLNLYHTDNSSNSLFPDSNWRKLYRPLSRRAFFIGLSSY